MAKKQEPVLRNTMVGLNVSLKPKKDVEEETSPRPAAPPPAQPLRNTLASSNIQVQPGGKVPAAKTPPPTQKQRGKTERQPQTAQPTPGAQTPRAVRASETHPKRVDTRTNQERIASGSGRVANYRCFPVELKQKLNTLAMEKVGLPVGQTARLFLEAGIDDYDAGEIESMQPELSPAGYTLFPKRVIIRWRPANGTQYARRSNDEKVTFRGIPKWVDERIAEIAKNLGVPVGEVARFLIEFEIKKFSAKKFVMPNDIVTWARGE